MALQAYRQAYRKEKDKYMAVPKFGGWDKKSGMPDYSMVFSRARANRKHQKSGARPASLGNESDLLTYRHYDDHDDEPIKFKKKKKLLRYLCCIMV